MNKKSRQYIGILVAIITYYIIHEGAHFIYALGIGVFKQINILGLGVQIDVYIERMTNTQMGIFCIVGSVATALIAYFLIALIKKIAKSNSKVFKACMYYITMALLLLDPIYLALLCDFVGGGDMNGIALIVPKVYAKAVFAGFMALHAVLIWKVVMPGYKRMFISEQ